MATSEIAKLESRWRENPQGLTFAPLAEAYRKLKDPSRALEILQPGLERHPDYIPANIVLGRCHWDLNDLPAAERAFTHVLSLDSENVIALKALADITERLVRYDEAERWLEALLAVDRSNDEARAQLARVRTLQTEQGAEAGQPDAPSPAAGFHGGENEPVAVESDAAELARPEERAAEPAALEGLAEEPAVIDPTELEPMALEGAALEPMALEPTAFEPTAFEPTAFEPTAFEPTAFEPTSFEPTSFTERSAAEHSAVDEHSAADQPAADELTEPSGFESFGWVSPADAPAAHHAEPLPLEQSAPPDELAEAAPSRDQPAADQPAAEPVLEHRDENAAPAPFFPDYSPPGRPYVSDMHEPPAAYDDGFGVERSEEIVLNTGTSEFQAPSAAEDLMKASAPHGDALKPEPAPFDSPVAEFTPEPAMEPAPGPNPEPHLAAAGPGYREPLGAALDPPAEPEPELVVTETMAEVYLRQGHVTEALAVYRELSRRSPDDVAVQTRIAELEEREASMRPARRAFAASETGGQSVAAFLQSVLGARPAPASGPRWSPQAGAPSDASPSDARGAPAAAEAPADTGAPTRPAGDPLSLGSVFGEEPPAASPAMPADGQAKPAPGVSFDEFFGGPRPQHSGPARQNPQPGGKSDDDLDQFHTWLQGLKR